MLKIIKLLELENHHNVAIATTYSHYQIKENLNLNILKVKILLLKCKNEWKEKENSLKKQPAL